MEKYLKQIYSEFIIKGIEFIENSNATYEEKLIALNELPTVALYVIGQHVIRLIYESKKPNPPRGDRGDLIPPL